MRLKIIDSKLEFLSRKFVKTYGITLGEISEQIIYIQSELTNTTIYFENGTLKKLPYHLGKVQKFLGFESNLLRIHRSYIVNTNFIKSVHKKNGFIRLVNKKVLPLSQTLYNKSNLQEKLRFKEINDDF